MKKQAMHLKEEHKVMQENEIRNQIVIEEKLTEVAEYLKSLIEQITIKIKSESNEMLHRALCSQLIKKKQELLDYTEEIERSKLYRLNIERERAVKELKSKQEDKMDNGKGRDARKRKSKHIIKHEDNNTNEKVKCVTNKKEKEMRYERAQKEQKELEEKKKMEKENRKRYEEDKRAEKEERVKEERIRAEEKRKKKNAQPEKETKEENKKMDLTREKEKHNKEGNAVETKEVNEKVKKDNTNKEDKYSCEENLAQLKEENKTLAQAVEAKSREADEARKTMEEMFEAKLKVKPAMVEFLERQVAALEEELECPVCLEVLTTSPIYKCADDHLICPGCRPKVKICPQCREKYPPGPFKRFREAERKTERLADFKEQVEEAS